MILTQDIRPADTGGSKGFTTVAVLSLALGIGVATAAFSELNGFIEKCGAPHFCIMVRTCLCAAQAPSSAMIHSKMVGTAARLLRIYQIREFRPNFRVDYPEGEFHRLRDPTHTRLGPRWRTERSFLAAKAARTREY